MTTQSTKKKEQKLYRGAYDYSRNNNVYTEETFDVYRDKKEMGLNFVAQTISRVSTGELLNIHVDYTVNKDFIPVKVFIDKTLGNEHVKESYVFNSKTNVITYKFKSAEEDETHEFTTSPKFHIATPTVCTSMLFLKSKKVDATSKTYFNTIISKNQWKFEEPPTTKSLGVERLSLSSENLNLDGSTVSAMEYKIFEQFSEESDAEENMNDFLRVYISPHVTIPYLVKSEEGTKMQVRYLNNLSEAEL